MDDEELEINSIINNAICNRNIPIERIKSISVDYETVSGQDVRWGFYEDIKPRVRIEFYKAKE